MAALIAPHGKAFNRDGVILEKANKAKNEWIVG
jgi:hypothetical protein